MMPPEASRVWLPHAELDPQARLRLFCLPYAGGGASLYYPWRERMPPGVECLGVQLPGREERLRERPFEQPTKLVEALAEALRPVLDVPAAIFGHSMGAVIGFELAHVLREESAGVSHLFASGSRDPRAVAAEPPFHHLPQQEFVETICRRFDGIPREVLDHAELMELLLPTLRADVTVIGNYAYRPRPPLDCPITALGGREDRAVPEQDLSAWKALTRSRFSRHVFPGDHFFLRHASDDVLRVVGEEIEAVHSD